MKCVSCTHQMVPTIDLGELYVSNFIPMEAKSEDYPKSRLDLHVCSNCGLGTLKDQIDPSLLYTNYWYYSGVNNSMKQALLDVVISVRNSVHLKQNDVWLDIACNDGTLLSYVPEYVKKVGIDPSDVQTVAGLEKTCHFVNDYFSSDAFYRSGSRKARVITCIAMFYDLLDPAKFLHDVREVLADNGVFVLQMSYTPLMFYQREIGNICAEHLQYYSYNNLTAVLEQAGFSVVDVELNEVNGGSFRVYCVKNDVDDTFFSTAPGRDVAFYRTMSLSSLETLQPPAAGFTEFKHDIEDLKEETVDFLKNCRKQGKTVYGYGASTKGNTLLQYFGIDHTLVPKLLERNPIKFGKKTVGTEIPIESDGVLLKDMPDYALVLPWHFIEEFTVRERAYLDNGGKFIVPSPTFEVISVKDLT